MYKEVYVGIAHDEKFDFNVEGNPNGYMPTIIYRPKADSRMPGYSSGQEAIYWDLIGNPACKKLDWGSWGMKLTACEMVEYLKRYKFNTFAKCLIWKLRVDFIFKGLGDFELVLDAVESDF